MLQILLSEQGVCLASLFRNSSPLAICVFCANICQWRDSLQHKPASASFDGKGTLLWNGPSQTWVVTRPREGLARNTGSGLPDSSVRRAWASALHRAPLLMLKTQWFVEPSLYNTICLNNTGSPRCRNKALEQSSQASE